MSAPTVTITLTPQELGLLKAGLASYRMELKVSYFHDSELRKSAQGVYDDALALTDRITEAQMALTA